MTAWALEVNTPSWPTSLTTNTEATTFANSVKLVNGSGSSINFTYRPADSGIGANQLKYILIFKINEAGQNKIGFILFGTIPSFENPGSVLLNTLIHYTFFSDSFLLPINDTIDLCSIHNQMGINAYKSLYVGFSSCDLATLSMNAWQMYTTPFNIKVIDLARMMLCTDGTKDFWYLETLCAGTPCGGVTAVEWCTEMVRHEVSKFQNSNVFPIRTSRFDVRECAYEIYIGTLSGYMGYICLDIKMYNENQNNSPARFGYAGTCGNSGIGSLSHSGQYLQWHHFLGQANCWGGWHNTDDPDTCLEWITVDKANPYYIPAAVWVEPGGNVVNLDYIALDGNLTSITFPLGPDLIPVQHHPTWFPQFEVCRIIALIGSELVKKALAYPSPMSDPIPWTGPSSVNLEACKNLMEYDCNKNTWMCEHVPAPAQYPLLKNCKTACQPPGYHCNRKTWQCGIIPGGQYSTAPSCYEACKDTGSSCKVIVLVVFFILVLLIVMCSISDRQRNNSRRTSKKVSFYSRSILDEKDV